MGCVFIGQDLDGTPVGFARVVYADGSIYEGMIDIGKRNGFGRYINGKTSYIGWWKNGKLHGNCRCFDWSKGLLQKTEGWFDNGTQIGPFKESESTYKYWLHQNRYFIKDNQANKNDHLYKDTQLD